MALPSVWQLRQRYDRKINWAEDASWVGRSRNRFNSYRRRASRGGLNARERRVVTLRRRQMLAADRSYRAWSARQGAAGTVGDPDYDQTAHDVMLSILKEYNLESLAGRLEELMLDGITDQAQLTLALQDTQEWKTRFAGNEKLKAAGLPVLSVAEYLATERSMAQVMKQHGLPDGFYDDPEDFGNFIGNSVSPAELESRVQTYSDIVNRQDPAVKAQLRAMGMTEGDLLAFTMDPERANPLIQRKYKQTLIGAAARRTGLTASNDYAERLAGMNISEEQAQAGYALISENLAATQRLGSIYGDRYGQGDFESEVFEGDGKATRKRKRLASQERAAFSGQSGVAQGSLRQSTSGQY